MHEPSPQLPCKAKGVASLGVPLAVVACPLAAPSWRDAAVPPADVEAPVECAACGGYVCPFTAFTDGGAKFVCCFCGAAGAGAG